MCVCVIGYVRVCVGAIQRRYRKFNALKFNENGVMKPLTELLPLVTSAFLASVTSLSEKNRDEQYI